jgi:hypothetical protein
VEDITLEEYFKSLNPNKILIGVLQQIKKIEIPVGFFADVPNSELVVSVNEDGTAFVFSLKDSNE